MSKVLVVVTSHDTLGDTGKKTGFWLEELAAPHYVMKDAGIEGTPGSPQGGAPRRWIRQAKARISRRMPRVASTRTPLLSRTSPPPPCWQT